MNEPVSVSRFDSPIRMRFLYQFVVAFVLLGPAWRCHAQTADEVGALIDRLVELDSIDLAKGVKFRPGLEPSLYAYEADESKMAVLSDPYESKGQGQPGAIGWYRVSFTVPSTIGKFALPKGGYNLGVESNVQGSWEIYTYINGKPAGLWSKEGMQMATDKPASAWMSNAPMPTKAGDQITIAILAHATPLGRGSSEGFRLRHLRLRYALAHTAARQPFYGAATGAGTGTGLHGAREMLRVRQGEELNALQARLRGPLERLNLVFQAAESGQLNDLTKAMGNAAKEINEALKK